MKTESCVSGLLVRNAAQSNVDDAVVDRTAVFTVVYAGGRQRFQSQQCGPGKYYSLLKTDGRWTRISAGGREPRPGHSKW